MLGIFNAADQLPDRYFATLKYTQGYVKGICIELNVIYTMQYP